VVSVKTADDSNPTKVLVIGAGAAGLVTAYFLQQRGIAYHVIDKADVLGSTWASLYPALRLNTSRYFSHPPHKPFPRRWGIFATGKQYHAHLVEFARQHQLNVQLGVTVHSVSPDPTGGYRVESSQGTARYPVVVLATGRFSSPHTPHFDGIEQFEGIKLHAHDYHGPQQLAGLRVMVVGNGPSGMDIAIDVGRHNAPTHPALLAMRTGITLKRRFPLGLSKHAWMIISKLLPPVWQRILLDEVVERFSAYSPQQLRGIKQPPPGQASSAAATRGPELIHAVRRGQVICVDGPARFHAHSVTLTDGSTHPIDAVVFATGYQPALGFLRGIPIEPDDQGWPARFSSCDYPIDYATLSYRGTYDVGEAVDVHFQPTQREVKGHAGLFQVGLYYKGKGTLYNINVEGEIAAAQIAHLIQACQND
jgi:cation diffusion facilitator CzcD-associated flavoprotein CzcO